MADATKASCSRAGFFNICLCADEFSPSQVALVLVAATIGVVTVLSLVYRITRVLLSLFLIPGKSVCPILTF
jgi:hypothetical protein